MKFIPNHIKVGAPTKTAVKALDNVIQSQPSKSSTIRISTIKRATTNNNKATIQRSIVSSRLESTTSIQQGTDFDLMVRSWPITESIPHLKKSKPKNYSIFVHDKLLFKNFNVFSAVCTIMETRFPTAAFNRSELEPFWKKEVSKVTLEESNMNKNLMKWRLRSVIRDVFQSKLMNEQLYLNSFTKLVKGNDLDKELSHYLKTSVFPNKQLLHRLNHLSAMTGCTKVNIVKDREFSMTDYNSYSKDLSENLKSPNFSSSSSSLSILDHKLVFRNRSNDYKNMKAFKKQVSDKRFIFMTGDEDTSLDYYRMLKLFDQTEDAGEGFKGFVVYFDGRATGVDIRDQKVSSGSNYIVLNGFERLDDIVNLF